MVERSKKPVKIVYSDEHCKGQFVFAVSSEDDFWLETFKTRKEAEKFVEVLGVRLILES